MKSIVLLFTSLMLISILQAQTPDWDWAVDAGDTSTDVGQEICVDAAGNTYTVGYFTGTVSFGGFTLTAGGGLGTSDVFVTKIDPDGNYLWAVSGGGGGTTDAGYGIALDAAGNLFVTGYFYDSANFGSTTLVSAGQFDIFIAKLDSAGNWLWAKRAGGVYYDQAYGVTTDGNGNCYLTGYFCGTADFGAISLIGPSTYGDTFVAKLDTDGNWIWAYGSVCAAADKGQSVAYDGSGNIYVTGSFEGTFTLGSSNLVSYGNNDAYVAKISTDGNWIWAVQAGGPFPDYAMSVASDTAGNAYITGNLTSEDAYFGSFTLHGDGWAIDLFVAKLDPDGTFLWATMAGAPDYNDEAQDIAVDGNGNCYVTGYFSRTASFGTHTLTSSNNSQDVFICKTDNSGNWLWALQAGGTAGDVGLGICHSGFSTFVTGGFRGTATFGTHSLSATGSYTDAFFVKLTEPSNGISTFPVTWDFEGPTFPPDDWTTADLDGGGSYWDMTTSDNHTPAGSQAASHYYNSGIPEGQNGWLITPAIAVPAGQYMTLSFWHQSWWYGDYRYSGVLANTTNDPNDPNWIELWTPTRVCDTWFQEFVDISAYGGQTVYFAFKYTGYDGHEWFVDDVSIYQVNPVTVFPAVWDFEDGIYPPVGWSKADLDGRETTWQLDETQNHTPNGSKSAIHLLSTAWDVDPGQNGWFITPPIEVPLDTNLFLHFWDKNGWHEWYAYSGVLVNYTNNPLDPNWFELWHPDSVVDDWTEHFVNISSYGGSTIYLAFVYQGFDAHDLYLDDISIEDLGAFTPPEVSIEILDGYPHLYWPEVPGATWYNIYGSYDPYFTGNWDMITGTSELEYTYTDNEPYRFFQVTAGDLPRGKNKLSDFPSREKPRQ